MANYIIIGGDGKEYGPVTETDVRQWLAEGRLNAQSQAKAESDAEFRPLEKFPEFAAVFGSAHPPAITPPAFSAAIADDYDLDLGDCITRAWGLLKNNFGPVVGVSTLVCLIIICINQLFGLITRPIIDGMILTRTISAKGMVIIFAVTVISAPVSTVFMAGLFKYYLNLIRDGTATVGDAFSGFGPQTGNLILLSFVQMIFIVIGYALCILPGIYLTVGWYFAIPLVIDRHLNFWDAMELSRRRVSKHWFVVFAAMLVFGLLGMCGIIACGIGVLVTMPLGMIALMYAYETLFRAEKN